MFTTLIIHNHITLTVLLYHRIQNFSEIDWRRLVQCFIFCLYLCWSFLNDLWLFYIIPFIYLIDLKGGFCVIAIHNVFIYFFIGLRKSSVFDLYNSQHKIRYTCFKYNISLSIIDKKNYIFHWKKNTNLESKWEYFTKFEQLKKVRRDYVLVSIMYGVCFSLNYAEKGQRVGIAKQ